MSACALVLGRSIQDLCLAFPNPPITMSVLCGELDELEGVKGEVLTFTFNPQQTP